VDAQTMKYRGCSDPAQAPRAQADAAARRAAANINPRTGLATDYLNHFNEAVMLLEMLAAWPDAAEHFLAWRPLTYREHFAASCFQGRDLAIAAYDSAEPALRERLGTLVGTMTAVLLATQEALRDNAMAPSATGVIATLAAATVKPLIARAGALINGEIDDGNPITPQAVVDELMHMLNA
jgi:hypothetical protein